MIMMSSMMMLIAVLALGTRPCRVTCSKAKRNKKFNEFVDQGLVDRNASERVSLSPDDQRRMIDRFVDLSLARYLDSHGKSHELDNVEGDNSGRNFRQLLYDWARIKHRHTNNCDSIEHEQFTTMKPGSIIKDSIPFENEVLMEAPYIDEFLQANLSDKAFQESGDVVGVGIDTTQKKIYRGNKAIQLIGLLSGHNQTAVRTVSAKDTKINKTED